MLPYLQQKKIASIAHAVRRPDGSMEEVEQDDLGLLEAASDLMAAVHAKDSKAVAAALKAAFEICDSEPHVEGEHLGE